MTIFFNRGYTNLKKNKLSFSWFIFVWVFIIISLKQDVKLLLKSAFLQIKKSILRIKWKFIEFIKKMVRLFIKLEKL